MTGRDSGGMGHGGSQRSENREWNEQIVPAAVKFSIRSSDLTHRDRMYEMVVMVCVTLSEELLLPKL